MIHAHTHNSNNKWQRHILTTVAEMLHARAPAHTHTHPHPHPQTHTHTQKHKHKNTHTQTYTHQKNTHTHTKTTHTHTMNHVICECKKLTKHREKLKTSALQKGSWATNKKDLIREHYRDFVKYINEIPFHKLNAE